MSPFAKDPTINTYVGMTTTEPGGVAYMGTICGEMKLRAALIGKPGNYFGYFHLTMKRTGEGYCSTSHFDKHYCNKNILHY